MRIPLVWNNKPIIRSEYCADLWAAPSEVFPGTYITINEMRPWLYALTAVDSTEESRWISPKPRA